MCSASSFRALDQPVLGCRQFIFANGITRGRALRSEAPWSRLRRCGCRAKEGDSPLRRRLGYKWIQVWVVVMSRRFPPCAPRRLRPCVECADRGDVRRWLEDQSTVASPCATESASDETWADYGEVVTSWGGEVSCTLSSHRLRSLRGLVHCLRRFGMIGKGWQGAGARARRGRGKPPGRVCQIASCAGGRVRWRLAWVRESRARAVRCILVSCLYCVQSLGTCDARPTTGVSTANG